MFNRISALRGRAGSHASVCTAAADGSKGVCARAAK